MQVTTKKLEFLKDENGNEIYDVAAIAKFRQKHIKLMERQNAKIVANPGKYKGFSVCDPVQYAETMVNMYQHHFREYKEVEL